MYHNYIVEDSLVKRNQHLCHIVSVLYVFLIVVWMYIIHEYSMNIHEYSCKHRLPDWNRVVIVDWNHVLVRYGLYVLMF